jgi:hypothetical protein
LLLALIHGKYLLLAYIHGKYLLRRLTWKVRSVPSRSPCISISTETCDPLSSNGLFQLSDVMLQYYKHSSKCNGNVVADHSGLVSKECTVHYRSNIGVVSSNPTQSMEVQGDSNMTGTDLCVNSIYTVPVIFEPPCISAICFRDYVVLPMLRPCDGRVPFQAALQYICK